MTHPLDPALLDLLACPCPHHAPIALAEDANALICQRCATSYPIREGIPVMLLDEAVAGPHGIGG